MSNPYLVGAALLCVLSWSACSAEPAPTSSLYAYVNAENPDEPDEPEMPDPGPNDPGPTNPLPDPPRPDPDPPAPTMPPVMPSPNEPDFDGDRLPDSVETNTNVFKDKTDTGTDPKNPDTDGDGIWDGDEVLPISTDLDLAKMGASPLHRNIFIEYDWFDDNLDNGPVVKDHSTCPAHSHKPTPQIMARVEAAFANAPLQNPDGTPGIKLIQDYGQGDPFTGGQPISDPDGMVEGGALGPEFQRYKATNLAPSRAPYFHWVLMPHRYRSIEDGMEFLGSSGNAELPGNGFMVSLYCWYDHEESVANTIMHELGHNLSLRHGGEQSTRTDDMNDKPNYNSVMSYYYQFDGIDTDCKPGGDHVLDFSRKTLQTLDENALSATSGICGEKEPWDWCKLFLSPNMTCAKNGNLISLDLNKDGKLTELTDTDDWALIQGLSSLVRFVVAPEAIACPPPPKR